MRIYADLTIEEAIRLGRITKHYEYLTNDELISKIEGAFIGEITDERNDYPFSYKHVQGYLWGLDTELLAREAKKIIDELEKESFDNWESPPDEF